MPLTRNRVTAAARIMLPNYPIVFCWIGLGWALDAPAQLNGSAALQYADRILPIEAWGVFLTTLGLTIGAALLAHNRTLCRVALLATVGVMGVFVLVFLAAAINGGATLSAPAWPYLGAIACLASERSLLTGERQ